MIDFQQELMKAIVSVATLLLMGLGSCGTQTNSETRPASVVAGAPLPGTEDSEEIVNEIVYFSTDNGLTWKNKSKGLPAETSIGLGGIAVSGNRLALLSKHNGLYFFDSREDKWMNVPTDQQLIQNNPGALLFYQDHIYAGTQSGGVFYSDNDGKSWSTLNAGLNSLTIRKLAEIDHTLYAATNSGLYAYNNQRSEWELEYGNNTLQVNGLTVFDGKIYIATNQGAFSSPTGRRDWKKVFSNGALHNIGSDDKALYAMVYNELFSSFDKGSSWQKIQTGLPAGLYTFNVIPFNNTLLAGQWDGVYRKDKGSGSWKFSSTGLPERLAVTNMTGYAGTIVVSGSERKLRTGMSADQYRLLLPDQVCKAVIVKDFSF